MYWPSRYLVEKSSRERKCFPRNCNILRHCPLAIIKLLFKSLFNDYKNLRFDPISGEPNSDLWSISLLIFLLPKIGNRLSRNSLTIRRAITVIPFSNFFEIFFFPVFQLEIKRRTSAIKRESLNFERNRINYVFRLEKTVWVTHSAFKLQLLGLETVGRLGDECTVCANWIL